MPVAETSRTEARQAAGADGELVQVTSRLQRQRGVARRSSAAAAAVNSEKLDGSAMGVAGKGGATHRTGGRAATGEAGPLRKSRVRGVGPPYFAKTVANVPMGPKVDLCLGRPDQPGHLRSPTIAALAGRSAPP